MKESEQTLLLIVMHYREFTSLEVTGGHHYVTLHSLLTVYTEHSGGSSKLITVLNRLGMASNETLDTHIVKVSAQHKQEGL